MGIRGLVYYRKDQDEEVEKHINAQDNKIVQFRNGQFEHSKLVGLGRGIATFWMYRSLDQTWTEEADEEYTGWLMARSPKREK